MKNHVLPMCFSTLFLLAVAVAPATAANWQLRMVPMGDDDWASIKFEDSTGECWRASGGNWVRCGEVGDVPDGHYEVIVVGGANDWYALRMNTETGQSWELGENDWQEMANQRP